MVRDNTDVNSSIVSSDADQLTLNYRLESPLSRGGRLAGAWIFGLLLGGVTYGCVVLGEKNQEMYYGCIAAAVIIGLLAAVLLWSAIQQTLAILLIPATTVEVELETIEPGSTMRFCVKQPGPIFLKSLRANLVCMRRRERQIHSHAQGRRRTRDPGRMVHHQNILDSDGGWLFPGQTRQWIGSLTIPNEFPGSGKEGSMVTEWQIEVWGRTQLILGFMQQFTLKVRRGD